MKKRPIFFATLFLIAGIIILSTVNMIGVRQPQKNLTEKAPMATLYDTPDPMTIIKQATIYDTPDPMTTLKQATIYDTPDPMTVKLHS